MLKVNAMHKLKIYPKKWKNVYMHSDGLWILKKHSCVYTIYIPSGAAFAMQTIINSRREYVSRNKKIGCKRKSARCFSHITISTYTIYNNRDLYTTKNIYYLPWTVLKFFLNSILHFFFKE